MITHHHRSFFMETSTTVGHRIQNLMQRQQQQQSSSSCTLSFRNKCSCSCSIHHQQPPPPPQVKFRLPVYYYNYQNRSFGTRRKRHQPSHHGPGSSKNNKNTPEYWEKEYIKTKEHYERITQKKSINNNNNEPQSLNEIISWKVLIVMAISPLLVCLIVPELRHHLFENIAATTGISFDNDTTTSDTATAAADSNKKE